MNRPPTRLGKIAAAPTAAASSVSARPSRLSAVNGRRGEEVDLPVVGRVWLELPGAIRWSELEAAAHKATRELGHTEAIPYAYAYEAQVAVRALADATRELDDHDVKVGTLEEWGGLDNAVINACWHAFGDVRERLDPVAAPLSADDTHAIAAAVKKNDAASLRAFGVVKLSVWLASTDVPPSTSPRPSSPSSD